MPEEFAACRSDERINHIHIKAGKKLWLALTTPQTFRQYQAVFKSIFV